MADSMASAAYWNARYDSDEYLFGEAPNRFLRANEARFRPGMRVLAIADGEGRNSVWLAELGCDVVATEISPAAIDKARVLAQVHGVRIDFRQVDLLDWDWPEGEFDAVVGIFFQVFDPEQRARIFAAMERALRPGGLLLIEGYRPEQLDYGTGGPPVLSHLYTEAMLRDAFGGMAIETIESYDAELSEGARHKGMSAVIDLVAHRPQ
ncbi:SAM-dependent methyltransferase [Sphingosinithalassobacter portus]|uniref:SAM-dependent methyltransferase n=1 Tax=Stakelama portus TaxID=2676234 RepID=UPI000D6E2B40|nr:class I SAM-dependent methyltransferase [Sphingosinithalassobacter portus]